MQSILVIGAGIGGLASALALAQRGYQVSVLEQAQELGEVGAGVQISPNGLAVLRALGVDKKLCQISPGAEAVELRDYRRGSLVARLDLAKHASDLTYLFVHRVDLVEVLFAACQSLGVLFQFGSQVDAYSDRQVTLTSGECLAADIIIGADGLHSSLRNVLNPNSTPFFTKQVACRAIVDNVALQPNVARVHMGLKSHIVSYPIRDGSKLNLVMVREQNDWVDEGWRKEVAAHEVQSLFAAYGGDIAKSLQQLTHVNEWGLFRHPVAKSWSDGCAVLVGDAAHPTLPFMAQGANLALEDAWVLAACLDKFDDTSIAVQNYQARRQDRVKKIVDTASGNAWKYHLSFPPIRLAAHSAMRFLSGVAPSKMVSQFDWIYRHDVTQD